MTHPTFHVSASWRAARHTRDAAATVTADPTRQDDGKCGRISRSGREDVSRQSAGLEGVGEVGGSMLSSSEMKNK